MTRRVIVCQIGAREHYAVPRILHRAGLLKALITDIWVPPGSALQYITGRQGERLRGRYHPELADARVIHFTYEALARAARRKISIQTSKSAKIMSQNAWFEAKALGEFSQHRLLDAENRTTVFAYSYAARSLLEAAKMRGALAVLGQIDGGEADERLISQLAQSRSIQTSAPAPIEYWENWRGECAIADRIVVNSDWSKHLLAEVGVNARKIDVVPVAYECEGDAPERSYPASFSHTRPLKSLFLGAATFRKGIIETLEAARHLAGRPVRFSIVGADPDGLVVSHSLPNVTYHGVVPRDRVSAYYAEADIFLFPTHSDGFGMAQIEALAAGLPVIASSNCARLVKHGRNGIVIQTVSCKAIAGALEKILVAPSQLPGMSRAARQFASTLADEARARLLEVVI